MTRVSQKRAFTLVELLVVITIIGILIALLLPAVQAAREAARRLQCENHLKQLALGCLSHENLTGRYPTNGWGFGWTGDADRGNDWRQPAGWLYNVLPFIDQQPLHDLGMGTGPWNNALKLAANYQRASVPLDVFYCPTRRAAKVYPMVAGVSGGVVNAAPAPTLVARTDYAANGGDYYTDPVTGGPHWASYYNAYGGATNPTEVENPPGQMTANARATFNGVAKYATGIMFVGSLIKPTDVTDGTSNTYLVGEKYLNPDNYETGLDNADNEHALMGDNQDISRWSGMNHEVPTDPHNFYPPLQDTQGVTNGVSWGSAHANGFQMAFCDGSVQLMSYMIDMNVHRWLSNRMDGYPVDPKNL